MTSYKNIASGHSRVGAQIGSIDGDLTISDSAQAFHEGSTQSELPEIQAELHARLDEIDAAIHRSRDTGDLDPEDIQSALDDVAGARELLPLQDRTSTHRFITRLKRIHGVVAGAADLTGKVAGAVSAVQTLL